MVARVVQVPGRREMGVCGRLLLKWAKEELGGVWCWQTGVQDGVFGESGNAFDACDGTGRTRALERWCWVCLLSCNISGAIVFGFVWGNGKNGGNDLALICRHCLTG